MSRSNPFDGKRAYTKFVWAIYERLMSRSWFSYMDIMKGFPRLVGNAELITQCEKYGELKKAFSDLTRLLKEKTGKECIEVKGSNRNKCFRYTGSQDNPLKDLMYASAIRDIRTYAQFCIDSAGFFPSAWLEYFFEDTIDLLEIRRRKRDGEQSILSSADRELKNIELLPVIYEAIRDRKVLRVEYKPAGKQITKLLIHPHLLKEYNGRWFLFGYAPDQKPQMAHNLALDRLVGTPEEIIDNSLPYVPAPKGYYEAYFKDIVGVSRNPNGCPVEDIIIRARNIRMFNLIESKKLHLSQITLTQYDDEASYGEFKIRVVVNNEFIGRILQMGAGLEVISPESVRQLFKQRTTNMASLYND